MTNLPPLDELHRLTYLKLTKRLKVHSFEPIYTLLDHLENLYLYGCRFEDLPADLCGAEVDENVIELIRSAKAAQQAKGPDEDRECKLLIVGNSAAGKTSLARWMLDDEHQPLEKSTHAIHLGAWDLSGDT